MTKPPHPLHPVSLRMTFEEKANLEKAAAGMSLAAYIRWRLFAPDMPPPRTRGNFPVKDHKALAQLLALLGQSRLANNVNQLARAANTGILPVTPETEEALLTAVREVSNKRIAQHNMQPLIAKREALKVQHQAERQAIDTKLETRWNEEQRNRSSRLRKGIAGAWDFLTGKYFKTRKQNEMESKFARERDNHERHALIHAQLEHRQALQELIRENRRKEAERILGLYRDAAKFRRMREGEAERDKDRGRNSTTMRPKRDRGLDLG